MEKGWLPFCSMSQMLCWGNSNFYSSFYTETWHYVLPSSWGWGWGFQIQLDYQAHVPFMTPGELGLRKGNLIYHGLNRGESELLNNHPLTLECSGLCLLSLMPSPTHLYIMSTPQLCSSALGHCPVACDQSHSIESSRQVLRISPSGESVHSPGVSAGEVGLTVWPLCPLEDSVCLPGKLHTNVHRILMCSAHCLLHYSPIFVGLGWAGLLAHFNPTFQRCRDLLWCLMLPFIPSKMLRSANQIETSPFILHADN